MFALRSASPFGMLHLTDQGARGSVKPRPFSAGDGQLIDGDPESLCDIAMYYERQKFTLNQVDKAGLVCVNSTAVSDELSYALDVIFNYRSAHSFQLNSFYTTLHGRAKKIDQRALTAQRLKRLESIYRKLHRRNTMQLSQMQDIGGAERSYMV